MFKQWEDCKFKLQWKTHYLFSIWLKLKWEGTGVSNSSGGNANYSNSVFVQSVIKNYLKHDGLKTTKMYFAQFWRLGILKFPVYKQGQFLVKALSWLAKYHLLHLNRERRWVNSGVPFIRALNSFIKTPPLWSHKSPFPYEFWGDINIPLIANSYSANFKSWHYLMKLSNSDLIINQFHIKRNTCIVEHEPWMSIYHLILLAQSKYSWVERDQWIMILIWIDCATAHPPTPVLMVRPNPQKWNLEIRSLGGK